MQLPESASDEDLYQWFVGSLAENGSAAEVRPDVIEVVVDNSRRRERLGAQAGPDDADERVWVHLTREQLRSVAYEEHDVFDDTDLDVIPRTATPVWQGLVAFAFYTEEEIGSRRPGEDHLVFHESELRASTVPQVPPVRSDRFW